MSGVNQDGSGRRTRRRLTRKLPWRPLGGLLGPAKGDVAQSVGALAFAAGASILTGLALAATTDRLERYPGLLLLIPAAIGLRGNVFGPLGARLSTAMQAGTMSWSWKGKSMLGQNVVATLVGSIFAAAGLAFAAFVLSAMVFADSGRTPLGWSDFVVISVFGGLLASLVVLGVTLGLAVASTRFGWDLDNVTAPLVTAAGDLVTLPSLILATWFVRRDATTTVLALLLLGMVVACVVALYLSSQELAKRIFSESAPALLAAATISLLAGAMLEQYQDRFLGFTVLLIVLPGYLAISGALGGILSNRLSTKLHLGLVSPSRWPGGRSMKDIRLTFLVAVPIFAFLGVLAGSVGAMSSQSSPGLPVVGAVVLTGGLMATFVVCLVAYYATVVVVRFGLNPDNLGIPLVTSTLDVVGAFTLIVALIVWGVS